MTARTPVPGPTYRAAYRLIVGTGDDADREIVLAWCRERYGAKAPTDAATAVQWCIGIAARNGYLREVMG